MSGTEKLGEALASSLMGAQPTTIGELFAYGLGC